VKGLEKGVYKYKLREHELEKVLDGDKRMELAIASLGQPWEDKAPRAEIL
jgi:hypothetical protein